MRKTQVTNLIKALPAALYDTGRPQMQIDAAQKVLNIYRAADQHALTARDKRILQIRLMDTARVLADVADLPGYRSKRVRQQTAQSLLMEFAQALDMSVQELQGAVAKW